MSTETLMKRLGGSLLLDYKVIVLSTFCRINPLFSSSRSKNTTGVFAPHWLPIFTYIFHLVATVIHTHAIRTWHPYILGATVRLQWLLALVARHWLSDHIILKLGCSVRTQYCKIQVWRPFFPPTDISWPGVFRPVRQCKCVLWQRVQKQIQGPNRFLFCSEGEWTVESTFFLEGRTHFSLTA